MNDEHAQQLLKRIREAGFGVPHEIAAVQSEINLLVAKELAGQLVQLSANISQAQTVLGTRIQELKDAISTASTASSRQADALVKWTKWYVVATVAILGLESRASS